MSTLSYYTSHSATVPARHISLAELAQLAQAPTVAANGVHPAQADKPTRARLKAQAALITPFDGNGKTKEAAERASYSVVVQDHDDDNKSESDIRQIYAALKVPYLAFTTSSHTDDAPRWKVVIPLAAPCSAEEHGMISRGLAQSLGTDTAQARTQQGFYAPHKLIDDAPYSVIDELASYPPVDIKDKAHPFTVEVMQGWAELEEAEKEEEGAAVQAQVKKLQPSNAEGAGIIGKIAAFYSHDLRSVLRARGYLGLAGKMLRPNSSSMASGVRLFDEGTPDVRCYSHHGAEDALSALNHGGHALDLPAAICALDFNNDTAAMVRHYAPLVDAEGQKQRQREYAKEQERLKTEGLFLYDQDGVQLFTHHEDGTVSPAMRSTEPCAPLESRQHPLTKIVDLSAQPKPPNWVLPNFIAEGLVMIAGGHGVGKTTVLLPLAMAVAGVHSKDYTLAPKHWRHVVYITEDIHQAQRIMTGYGEHLDWNNKDIFQNMRERVHVVEACRMSAQKVARAGAFYREKFSRTVTTTATDGQEYTAELLPLIVIDTMAATIELENENDNSEASQAVAALKQQFEGLPTWIVGHVAKANLGRSESVTLRGAGAFEADANQVLYLVKEDNSRWLVRGKTRFESPWQELEIKSDHRIITVTNQFGDVEELVLRWSIASPPDNSRAERAEKAKTERDQLEAEELKRVILTNVAQRYAAGSPLNKTALRDVTGRSAAITSNAIATLIADAWLHEIEVPAKERLKNKHSFLVALDDQERAEFLEIGIIPEAKQWIPESWKKQAEAG